MVMMESVSQSVSLLVKNDGGSGEQDQNKAIENNRIWTSRKKNRIWTSIENNRIWTSRKKQNGPVENNRIWTNRKQQNRVPT